MTVQPPQLDRRVDRLHQAGPPTEVTRWPVPTTNQDPIPTTSIREQDELLEAIFRAHAAPLRGRLLRSTRDPAVADDLVSESFLRLGGGDPGGPRAAATRRPGCTGSR